MTKAKGTVEKDSPDKTDRFEATRHAVINQSDFRSRFNNKLLKACE